MIGSLVSVFRKRKAPAGPRGQTLDEIGAQIHLPHFASFFPIEAQCEIHEAREGRWHKERVEIAPLNPERTPGFALIVNIASTMQFPTLSVYYAEVEPGRYEISGTAGVGYTDNICLPNLPDRTVQAIAGIFKKQRGIQDPQPKEVKAAP